MCFAMDRIKGREASTLGLGVSNHEGSTIASDFIILLRGCLETAGAPIPKESGYKLEPKEEENGEF